MFFSDMHLSAMLFGAVPTASACDTSRDLADWFCCFGVAAAHGRPREVVSPGAIMRVTTTVRVVVHDTPQDNVARRGRLLPSVRR